MSPDWSAKVEPVPYAKLADPQSLNLYSYTLNNPLAHVDKDGHCLEDLCIGEGIAAYELYTAAAAATAAYLASPSGQQAIHAGAQLLHAGAHALGQMFSAKRPGTKGKPDHQQTAKEEAAKIGGQQEVRIPTPGGNKGTRVADAARVNPQTGKVEAVTQVIRPTPAGNVPKREQQAAQDIHNATGVTPTLVPVRPLPPPTTP